MRKNLEKAYFQSRDDARSAAQPSTELARRWHELLMDGLSKDDSEVALKPYIGTFRGEPGLERCRVKIGTHLGAEPDDVASELGRFEEKLNLAMSELDKRIPAGTIPQTEDGLNAIIELCAWVHCEWVRIHPFGNGNGRTARIWCAYIAMRYGLPPFVRLRPRPDGGYGEACAKAMTGEWTATIPEFQRMFDEAVGS